MPKKATGASTGGLLANQVAKATKIINDNLQSNQRLECVTRHSQADVRLRLALLHAQKHGKDSQLPLEDFVNPDGTLVSKSDMCRKIKAYVTSMRETRRALEQKLDSLDKLIDDITRDKEHTSYKVRSMAADALKLYDLVRNQRSAFHTVDFVLSGQGQTELSEDKELNKAKTQKDSTARRLRLLNEDTLLLQLETMKLYLKNRLKEEAVIQGSRPWEKTTYDKNLDSVCQQFRGQKGGMDAFRKMLLEQPQRFLRGKHLRLQHFFRPDGAARTTPDEVCKAIRYYGGRRFWGMLGS